MDILDLGQATNQANTVTSAHPAEITGIQLIQTLRIGTVHLSEMW